MKMSFLLSCPKENINPNAGDVNSGSALHWIGESWAHLTAS